MRNRAFLLFGVLFVGGALALAAFGSFGAQTGPGPSWFGGFGPGGMMRGGPGMMGRAWPRPATPLVSLDGAVGAFRSYLAGIGNSDLVLDEVMEFDQNFYAIVKEKSSGRGAFELLADRATGAVFLEYGPAMMWNTAYGHMAGGGMMGGFRRRGAPAQPAVTADVAREIAQRWLDANLPGSGTEAPDAFPGYYTIHTTRDGKISGMLSVHADTRRVWYHSWHGAFRASVELGD